VKQTIKKGITSFCYKSGLSRRAFGERFAPRDQVLILLYHQIKNPENRFEVAVSQENFDTHMRFVAENFKVISLKAALEMMRRGEQSDQPAAVITFDDGYRDNLTAGLPVLRKYGLPATFFIAAGSMGNQEPMWTSRVEYYFKKTNARSLRLETLPGLGTIELNDAAKRLYSCHAVKAEMKKVPDEGRIRILEELEQKTGLKSEALRGLASEMLSWDEVREMASDPLVEIGSHSVTHRMLANLSEDEVREELAASKAMIEKETGREVPHFSYPGNSYNDRVRRIAREAGYEAACAVDQEICGYGADRFALKRVHIENGKLDSFLAEITLLLSKLRKWKDIIR